MSYRLNTQVKPLIWAEASIELHSGSRIEFVVKVKAQFKRRSTANNVEIYVPVPDDADSPKFRVGFTPFSMWYTVTDCHLKSIGRCRNSALRTRKECICMENQATWRRSRISYASAIWLAICQRRRDGKSSTYHCRIRDPLLYSLRYSSAVPQDSGEVRIPGFAVGEIYNSEWGRAA